MGAKEIGFTVLSISVSLVAVFIPILLMGGIVGRLFREFAVTLSVAIGVSMVVSLTTTPMMCAMLLKPHDDAAAWPALSVQRTGLRLDSWAVRSHAWLGAAASVHHDAGHAGDDRLDGLSVRDRSQGILSAAGYRPLDRAISGRSGHLVSGDGAVC